MKTNAFLRAAILAATAAGLAAPASAGVVVTSQDFSLKFLDDNLRSFGSVGADTSATLERFDPSLGSLDSAVFKLESSFSLSASVMGEERAPDGFTVVQLDAGTDFFLFVAAPTFAAPPEFSDLTGLFTSCDAGFGAPCTSTDATSGPLNASIAFDAADLAVLSEPIIAPRDIDVALSFGTIYLLDILSDFSSGLGGGEISGTWEGTVSIEYSFTPPTSVAEPSTGGLLVLAAGTLLFRHRKRSL